MDFNRSSSSTHSVFHLNKANLQTLIIGEFKTLPLRESGASHLGRTKIRKIWYRSKTVLRGTDYLNPVEIGLRAPMLWL